LVCGTRRGPLPHHVATMIAGFAPPVAAPEPPPTDDAPEADDAEDARPGWLPAPRATAVAILSMLAFGVLAGSLVKPEAESPAAPAARPRPGRAPRQPDGPVVGRWWGGRPLPMGAGRISARQRPHAVGEHGCADAPARHGRRRSRHPRRWRRRHPRPASRQAH